MKDEINNKYINNLLNHIILLLILTIVCIALSNMGVILKSKTLIHLKIIHLNIPISSITMLFYSCWLLYLTN